MAAFHNYGIYHTMVGERYSEFFFMNLILCHGKYFRYFDKNICSRNMNKCATLNEGRVIRVGKKGSLDFTYKY